MAPRKTLAQRAKDELDAAEAVVERLTQDLAQAERQRDRYAAAHRALTEAESPHDDEEAPGSVPNDATLATLDAPAAAGYDDTDDPS